MRSIGSVASTRSLTAAPLERPVPDEGAELIDDQPRRVEAAPLAVVGFADGIQAALTLTWREHRPVQLTYVAAGCVGTDGRLLEMAERLDLVVSRADREWVDGLGSTVDVTVLDEDRPDELDRATLGFVGAERELLEREVMDRVTRKAPGYVVVDGTITNRAHDPSVIGVVKTTRRRWLADESVLFGLPAGWMSPRFVIAAGAQGAPADRYSCYLRLFDASNRGWDHGLVRLESWDPDLLEPLAALSMIERQHPNSSDRRGDRHLASMRACEQVLRARRPVLFNL